MSSREDPWELLEAAAADSIETIWDAFAKDGAESAVFAPFAQYPNAAAWLASRLSMSPDGVLRKLGAMLAGWIQDPQHVHLLSEMLDRERQAYREERMVADSVAEDIMFAATRWAESPNPKIRNAGIEILARIVRDALESTPWNSAYWAFANLYRFSRGKHPVFQDAILAKEKKLQGQQLMQDVINAYKQKDEARLEELYAAPSEFCQLTPENDHYQVIHSLWGAASNAETSLR